MRISFDLDDTLICYGPSFPRESRLPWYKRLIAGHEPLREGAPALLRRLQASGWEVWVYTTSRRSIGSVRRWLLCHGIRVAGVINQDVHEANFCRSPNHRALSKHPGAFGIDLHVDDCEGVRMEGETHGFNVLVISPHDEAWAERVWLAAESLQRPGASPRQ